jgi:hypothetical protein
MLIEQAEMVVAPIFLKPITLAERNPWSQNERIVAVMSTKDFYLKGLEEQGSFLLLETHSS